jgi:hypothetical protein
MKSEDKPLRGNIPHPVNLGNSVLILNSCLSHGPIIYPPDDKDNRKFSAGQILDPLSSNISLLVGSFFLPLPLHLLGMGPPFIFSTWMPEGCPIPPRGVQEGSRMGGTGVEDGSRMGRGWV